MLNKIRSLWTAADQLEQVLDRAAPAQQVDQALAALAQAVQQHRDTLKSPEGKVADVDSPRQPSPVVARGTRDLRQELDDILKRIQALRQQVPGATPSAAGSAEAASLAGALPVAPEAGAIPNFALFRSQVDALVADLKRFEGEEAELILDAVNTEVGAGD